MLKALLVHKDQLVQLVLKVPEVVLEHRVQLVLKVLQVEVVQQVLKVP